MRHRIPWNRFFDQDRFSLRRVVWLTKLCALFSLFRHMNKRIEAPALTDRSDAASRTLADALATELRSAVLRGDIAPGTKLRLGDLRARFGVSLSPLREALSRLAAEGVVAAESQRGYRVPDVSLEGLAEVNAIRCHIEPFALAESIRRGGDHWEERLVA